MSSLGIEPVIPHRENERARHDPKTRFDRKAYRQRFVVEQTVGWLKECRRVGTRFDKLAVNFAAFVKLAIIHLCLRKHFSDTA